MRANPESPSLLDETLATSSTRRKVGRGAIVALQVFTFVVLMGTWQGLYVFEHRDAPQSRERLSDAP